MTISRTKQFVQEMEGCQIREKERGSMFLFVSKQERESIKDRKREERGLRTTFSSWTLLLNEPILCVCVCVCVCVCEIESVCG